MNIRHLDLNDPSFFRTGGIVTPGRVNIKVGKNPDGCWYIDLTGPVGVTGNIRSVMTPLQMFNLCSQTLGHMGYELHLKAPDQGSYELQLAAADKP